MICPCGSKLKYEECCGPFIEGKKEAPTAEALMRSRYSGHVKVAGSYLKRTLAPEKRQGYDEAAVQEWAGKSEWLGLQILSVKNGLETDRKGTVEFVAKYKTDGKVLEHHEVAEFRKDSKDGRWYFLDGDAHTHEEGKGHSHEPIEPVVREGPKVGRNDPCPCGSGKKYKKCCAV